MAVYFNGTKVSTIYNGDIRLTRVFYQGVQVFSEEAIVKITLSARKKKFRESGGGFTSYGWEIDYIAHLSLENTLTGTENVNFKIWSTTNFLNNAKKYENPYLLGAWVTTDSSYVVPDTTLFGPDTLTLTYAGIQRVINLPHIHFNSIPESDLHYGDTYTETYSTVN